MRLLSLGLGKKGCKILELLYQKGEKVNNIPLFKCYAVHQEVPFLRNIVVPTSNKFSAWLDDYEAPKSILNTIFSRNEFFEATLIITEILDTYSYELSKRIGEEMLSISDDPIIQLVLLPSLEYGSDYEEIRRRLKVLTDYSHFMLLFEDRNDLNKLIVESLNMLALVGEIDLKKRISGEVVIDTSDIFNSFMEGGLSAIGYANTHIKRSFANKLIFWKKNENPAEKAERMKNLLVKAIDENLSARCDLETAKSALVLFGGNPDDITMDGMFSCLTYIDKLFPRIELRYGDYPIPGSPVLKAMVLFSGMTGFKF
jgi:hypothetical protein